MNRPPKTLYDISWQVTEPQYRADPALSYSTLARFEREGFSKLSSLFEHITTPSLTFGSAVDAALTGGKEEFDRQFFVADFKPVGDKEKQIAELLFKQFGSTLVSFNEIPEEYVIQAANTFDYCSRYKDSTRVSKLTESCSVYYQLLALAGSRTVISNSLFEKVRHCVTVLRNSYVTSGYFADNQEDSSIQRYWQLKFRHSFEGVDYRCMMDLAVVNYDKKVIIPCDLKTSGHPEWEFQDSFKKWSYMIQARLYWRILRAIMDEDDYFKDFSLENYRFIVVNKCTLTPLVWEFPLTKEHGTLVDEVGNEYRDPFEIGRELQYYLKERPQVPSGIDMRGLNTISCLRLKNKIEI